MKTTEGQMCLFKWRLYIKMLALIFDSSVVLGTKVEVSVKQGTKNFRGSTKERSSSFFQYQIRDFHKY